MSDKTGIEWPLIETAPRDGTEIIGYRPDQGRFVFRWASMEEVVPKDVYGDPIDDYDDHEGWWHDVWGWLEGDLEPTHWTHFPDGPHQ